VTDPRSDFVRALALRTAKTLYMLRGETLADVRAAQTAIIERALWELVTHLDGERQEDNG
jgi:hypothetical protein